MVRIQGVIRMHNKLCNQQATLKDGQKKTINDFIFVFFASFVLKKQPVRLCIETQQQKLITIPNHQTALSYSILPSYTISFIKKSPSLNLRSTSAGLRARRSRETDRFIFAKSFHSDILDKMYFPSPNPRPLPTCTYLLYFHFVPYRLLSPEFISLALTRRALLPSAGCYLIHSFSNSPISRIRAGKLGWVKLISGAGMR